MTQPPVPADPLPNPMVGNGRAPRCWALIPAAGAGRRFGADRPKQYLELGGQRVIDHTLDLFLDHPAIAGCAVVLDARDAYWDAGPHARHPAVHRAVGGAERSDSVRNGLEALVRANASTEDWVLVHDAARPCLRRADLDALLAALADEPVGALLAVPIHDTVKRTEVTQQQTDRIAQTVSRAGLWRAFTPQAFRLGLLRQALAQAAASAAAITDDASAVERLGLAPRLIAGHADNLKITRPEDLPLARFYLLQQGRLC